MPHGMSVRFPPALIKVCDDSGPESHGAYQIGCDAHVFSQVGAARLATVRRGWRKHSAIQCLGWDCHIQLEASLRYWKSNLDSLFSDEHWTIGSGRVEAVHQKASPHDAPTDLAVDEAEARFAASSQWVVIKVFVQLEGESHPDGLATQCPAAAALTRTKLVQAEDEQARQDGDVRPFVPASAYFPGVRRPFFTSQKLSCRGVEFGVPCEPGCDGTNREDQDWGQRIVSASCQIMYQAGKGAFSAACQVDLLQLAHVAWLVQEVVGLTIHVVEKDLG
jgi:hypothetical protein